MRAAGDDGRSTPPAIRIAGLTGLPEIKEGDDLTALVAAAVERLRLDVDDGDVFVVTQKIVSKAEGRVARLEAIEPSPLARVWAERCGKDPRLVELVLRDSVRIVRMDGGVLVAETPHGFVCANAGVDSSNVPHGCAARLPLDPDASARRLAAGLRAALGRRVGVVVSDTFGRPWREGQVNVALGVAGFDALHDYRGSADTFGRPLRSTAIAVADELASAAELVMGKTRGIPAAVVLGARLPPATAEASARVLVRSRDRDLFR
ncbi:MAG TPA: coenzyme F420-0:L-glutamate ligase [Vicinamibacterales bacterium]|nr:coenzyme F420-0:L-glutamate ligase [Vicinamibacterales bacterium]